MNRVFEHEIDEVGCRLDKLIQLLQVLQISPFLLVEYVEIVLRGVEIHILDLCSQVSLLLGNLLIPLLQLLLLILQRSDLLIDLLLHHLVQILLLDLKLLHDTSERFLKSINLIIELLPDLEFQL